MIDARKPRKSGWFTVATVVLGLLGAYVGGNFWLGGHTVGRRDYSNGVVVSMHGRAINDGALVIACYPMSWIESRARGECIVLWNTHDGTFGISEPTTFNPP
jgi:hypothetical protein